MRDLMLQKRFTIRKNQPILKNAIKMVIMENLITYQSIHIMFLLQLAERRNLTIRVPFF